MIEKEKVWILEILSYGKSDDKNKNRKLTLPSISEWTKDICEAINSLPFDKECYLYLSELNESADEIEKFKILETINDNYKVNSIYKSNDLPDGINFVRFNGCVVLRDDDRIDEYINKCKSSIVENLGIVSKFDIVKTNLLEQTKSINKYSVVEDDLKNISKICALSAKFSSSNRPEAGTDNIIWNELLQNANDHILDDGNMFIDISEEQVVLKYSDKGFSIRDFIAVSTSGNSGNVINNEENREGRKGTGFKAVYNLFEEVIIESGEVRCGLKDGEYKKLNIAKDDIILPKIDEIGEWENSAEKKYYPIPLFEKIENTDKTTKITLKFSKESKVENYVKFLKGIFGEDYSNYEENFEASKVFLFLDKIKKIDFNINGKSFPFDKEKYISENYYKEEKGFEIADELLVQNTYWNKEEREEILEKKSKITLLFPKNDEEIEIEKCIYSTLPIKNANYKLPFYINLPLLELDDSRTGLTENRKEWNKGIIQLALCGEDSSFSKIFNGFTEDGSNDDIITKRKSYKYFPYEFLKDDLEGISWKETLEEIEFIQTTKDGEQFAYYSLVQRARKEDIDSNREVFVFLPDYMYWWFGANDGKTGGFTCEIPFVYYEGINKSDEGCAIGAHSEIKSKIKEIYDEYKEEREIVSLIGRKQNREVGKVLLKIRDYILADRVYENRFCKLLKHIRKYEVGSHTFKHILVIIFEAYLSLHISANDKYHCINNRNFNFEKTEKIEEYKDIIDVVEKLKNDIYGSDDDSDNEWYREKYRVEALRLAIGNILNENFIESPYVKYTYELDKEYINETKEIRLEEQLLGSLTPEIKCDLSEEVLVLEKGKKEKETIEDWIAKGFIYGKNSKGNVCKLTSNSYYGEGKIKDDNVFCDDVYRDYLINLEEEIKKPEFYKRESDELIGKVTETYDVDDWKYAVKNALRDELSNDKTCLLLNILINYDGIPIEWNKRYSGLISGIITKENCNKEIFSFKEGELYSLPEAIKTQFDIKVSSESKEAKHESMENNTLEDIVKKRVYLIDDADVKNKKLHCLGKLEEKIIVVLFGENAFGKMLKERFDCNEFSQNKAYKDMSCNSNYGFWGESLKDMELNETDLNRVKEKVKKIWDKNKADKDSLINLLVSSFEVKGENKWIRAKGYGANEKEYMNKICPVCKSILLAEKSVLKLSYVTVRKKDKSFHLPIMLCRNCYESFEYTETVYADFGDNLETELRINNTGDCKINLVFDMYAQRKKEMEVNISFLNRWIWYIRLS